MADENFEDDIFDDLYVAPSLRTKCAYCLVTNFDFLLTGRSYDDEPSKAEEPAPAPAPVAAPEPIKTEPAHVPQQDTAQHGGQDSNVQSWQGQAESHESHGDQSGYNAGAGNQSYNDNAPAEDDNYGPINVKEDG